MDEIGQIAVEILRDGRTFRAPATFSWLSFSELETMFATWNIALRFESKQCSHKCERAGCFENFCPNWQPIDGPFLMSHTAKVPCERCGEGDKEGIIQKCTHTCASSPDCHHDRFVFFSSRSVCVEE